MIEVSTLTMVAFWGASAMTIGFALIVVTQRDVFRAAIALAGSFLGVGILYFVLSAEFVGVVQILVYVGAISALMAFAVMFIQDVSSGSRPVQGRLVGAAVAVLILAAVAFTALNTDWSTMDDITDPVAVAALTEGYVEIGTGDDLVVAITAPPGTTDLVIENGGVLVDSTGAVGVLLIREYVLAFQIIGLLLVAALIGGLLMIRTPGPGSEAEAEAEADAEAVKREALV
ncbi:MAG: NADH-quinone oxidoreductase subunit J [Chloroflexi bacterium]|nr:NADH-quinone oxidoreductase subunit J [Chloroflexota bacterium]